MLFLHWSERRRLCPEERVSVANVVSFTGQKGANSALENEFQWLNIVLRRSTQLRAIKEGILCFMKYQPPTQSEVSQQIRPPTQSASVRSVCARRSESADTSPDSLGKKTEMDNWLIERMQERDLTQVADIERRTFTDPWSEQGFHEELESPDALYLCVRQPDRDLVIGYCGYIRSFEDADIVNVAVDEPFRGRGIARQMLMKLMEAGYEQGVENYTLEVRAGNTAAISLYEKLGFRSAGIRPGFYSNPREDALIMWKYKQQGAEERG